MSRYKGRTKPTLIERDFPHHVEMLVPLGGLGSHLDAMHEWHRAKGIEAMRGRSRRDETGRNYIRWCFGDPHVAAQFVNEFGGAVGKLDQGCESKPRPCRMEESTLSTDAASAGPDRHRLDLLEARLKEAHAI